MQGIIGGPGDRNRCLRAHAAVAHQPADRDPTLVVATVVTTLIGEGFDLALQLWRHSRIAAHHDSTRYDGPSPGAPPRWPAGLGTRPQSAGFFRAWSGVCNARRPSRHHIAPGRCWSQSNMAKIGVAVE